MYTSKLNFYLIILLGEVYNGLGIVCFDCHRFSWKKSWTFQWTAIYEQNRSNWYWLLYQSAFSISRWYYVMLTSAVSKYNYPLDTLYTCQVKKKKKFKKIYFRTNSHSTLTTWYYHQWCPNIAWYFAQRSGWCLDKGCQIAYACNYERYLAASSSIIFPSKHKYLKVWYKNETTYVQLIQSATMLSCVFIAHFHGSMSPYIIG